MNCNWCLLLPLFFLVAFIPLQATAKNVIIDLGIVGTTYPVIESDIITKLQNTAERLDKAKEDQQSLEQLQTYQPTDIHSLPLAEHNRTFIVDTRYVLDHDIVDVKGNIIYPRGYIFNPLDYMGFPGGLIIIDGTDEEQIKWFLSSPYANNHKVKIMLADGYAAKVAHQLKRPVFYLTTTISQRLKLSAVPSVVIQKENNLHVHEIKISTKIK